MATAGALPACGFVHCLPFRSCCSQGLSLRNRSLSDNFYIHSLHTSCAEIPTVTRVRSGYQDTKIPAPEMQEDDEEALNERIRLLMGGLSPTASGNKTFESDDESPSQSDSSGKSDWEYDEFWWEQGKKVAGRQSSRKPSWNKTKSPVVTSDMVSNLEAPTKEILIDFNGISSDMELVWSRSYTSMVKDRKEPAVSGQGNDQSEEAKNYSAAKNSELRGCDAVTSKEAVELPNKLAAAAASPTKWKPGALSEVLQEKNLVKRWVRRRNSFSSATTVESNAGSNVGQTEFVDGRSLKVNLDLKIFEARKLGRHGKFEAAEALFRECIMLWPSDGRAYVSLGKLLVQQGRKRDARQLYEEGCQAVGGENAHIWQSWAVLELSFGNVERARTLFEAATSVDRTHSPAWHGWAILELKAGNVSKARALLKKGVRMCGGSNYLFHTLGTMEAKAGRVEEARALFVRATTVSSQSVASWLSWALLEAQEGKVSAARKLFKRALESSPRSRYVYQSWALFEAKQGRAKEARLLFNMGAILNPRDAPLRLSHALFEFSHGLTQKARLLFEQGSKSSPRYAPLWRAWGWMEWKSGAPERARELYRTAAALEPQSARLYQAWGVLEESCGDSARARQLFQQSLRLEPGCVPAWMAWATMEERLGNAVRAEQLKALCQQQASSVEESGWDMSELIGPAFDRVRSFFNFDLSKRGEAMDKGSSSSGSSQGSRAEIWEGEDDDDGDDEDLDSFLESAVVKKLPIPVRNQVRQAGVMDLSSDLHVVRRGP